MPIPTEITFRGMSPTEALETSVHTHVERLARVHDRIQHVHVWIDLPSQHHRHGPRFQVRLTVALPGVELAVSHDSGHEDAHVAIADAFVAARRQVLTRVQA